MPRGVPAQPGQHRALVAKGGVGQQLAQALLIPGAAQADQVVAEPPADALDEMLEHHTVEAAEQQWSLAEAIQRQADVIEFAAGEEHPDGIHLQDPGIAQQWGELLVPEGAPLAHAIQQGLGGPLPGNHIDGERYRLIVGKPAEGVAGQQLTVAVGNQQQP